MARPFLADPNLVEKAWSGREAEVNTCIACNQAKRQYEKGAALALVWLQWTKPGV